MHEALAIISLLLLWIWGSNQDPDREVHGRADKSLEWAIVAEAVKRGLRNIWELALEDEGNWLRVEL